MKTLKIYITITVAIFLIGETAFSQHNHGGGGGTMGNSHSNEMVMAMPARTMIVTDSFKVWGKCDMCKARIEKGLKMDGVSKATWDVKSKIVDVTYDPMMISIPEMKKKMAALGHDTRKYRATEEAYAKLPVCCNYERKK